VTVEKKSENSHIPATSASSDTDDNPSSKPLTLTEARALANNTFKIINETEQSLLDGIRLQDKDGVLRYVVKPLNEIAKRWPILSSRQDDQREHFGYCRDAASNLHVLSLSAMRDQTVSNMKYLRVDEENYNKSKKKCEASLKQTDDDIRKKIADDEVEMRKNLGGGKECLTVLSVNEDNGKVEALPRPSYCKS
jgi:hypothetical protein